MSKCSSHTLNHGKSHLYTGFLAGELSHSLFPMKVKTAVLLVWKRCFLTPNSFCRNLTCSQLFSMTTVWDLIVNVYIFFTVIKILEYVNSLKPTYLEIPESFIISRLHFIFKGSLTLPFRLNKQIVVSIIRIIENFPIPMSLKICQLI